MYWVLRCQVFSTFGVSSAVTYYSSALSLSMICLLMQPSISPVYEHQIH